MTANKSITDHNGNEVRLGDTVARWHRSREKGEIIGQETAGTWEGKQRHLLLIQFSDSTKNVYAHEVRLVKKGPEWNEAERNERIPYTRHL